MESAMDLFQSCSITRPWNLDHKLLTGRFPQEMKASAIKRVDDRRFSVEDFGSGSDKAIGCYPVPVQEVIIIDDLLSAFVGIEGRYISIKQIAGKNGVCFQVDPSMDLAIQELIKRIFPLCESFLYITSFVDMKTHFKNGVVNHAFAAALRTLLIDYQSMVAQLEHQFRLERLSLQGLWFYCQPMMGVFQALSGIVGIASSKNLSGSDVLNLLQNQTKMLAGDNCLRLLLEKMTESTSAPYLRILERWIYEGVIDDPYGEFFIVENKSLQKESLTLDYEAKYWRQRYTLKDKIPSFLVNVAEMILTTGKYLNVMRECGYNVQVPQTESIKKASFNLNHRYLEYVKHAYKFASTELLNLIIEKYDLMGKLQSMKRYFFLDHGDFLVHFMDIAKDELMTGREKVSREKLQSLLDLALRSTAVAAYSCHENVTCNVEKFSLLKTLEMLQHHRGAEESGRELEEQRTSVSGIEAFSLNFKIEWPISIVITRKSVMKYQLIFRFLFHCKNVSRQLCEAWQAHQGIRSFKLRGTLVLRSSLLCRSMLKFNNSLLHYLTFEVLEQNWHVMSGKLGNSTSIDEVAQCHDAFLEKCMGGCLLLIPELVHKVEKVQTTCLNYTASVNRWLNSSCVARTVKGSLAPIPGMAESLMKFEEEFREGLDKLGEALQKNSQQGESYSTQLSHCLTSTTPN